MADYLADLNPAQREAVTHLDGPVLIIAGPGSGKTRVITRRIVHLLESGVRPHEILAITFTNKAAGEMRRRVEDMVPGNRLLITTFHSFGVRILRQYAERLGLDRHFTIYDQPDRLRVVKQALDSAGLDGITFTPERIQGAISRAKNQLLGPEAYASKAHDYFGQAVAHLYPIYEKRLRDQNAVDFDDLLYWPALAMRHDPEIRADLDARFRYLLIDEYQDTNLAQYALARGLSTDFPNLCVVGDPDQSVYGWRGADIRNILEFERDFPDARVIILDQNYRSTQRILRAAAHLIAHNSRRKSKGLSTANPVGKAVSILTYDSGLEEARGIAKRIRQEVGSGKRRWRDFAIFIRVNALSRALEMSLASEGVPFQMVKGFAFFDRKENRDVLAYLRLLINPRDDVSFLRIVNEPSRGIGKVSLDHLAAYAQPRGMSLLEAAGAVQRIDAIKGKAARGLADFAVLMGDLSALSEHEPEEIVAAVLDTSGYRHALLAGDNEEDRQRLANVDELVTAARQYTNPDGPRTLAGFLENITLASDVDTWDDSQDWVSIMTLHSAKGLEFPVVYIAAFEQGLLPHERSNEHADQLEEERRLAFVGMTRAMEELYLSRAKVREFRGLALHTIHSQFLAELPEEELEDMQLVSEEPAPSQAMDDWRKAENRPTSWGWAEVGLDAGTGGTINTVKELMVPATANGSRFKDGMVVRHDSYGLGRVTEVGGFGALRKIKVRFASHGERTFLADKAKLEIVGPNPSQAGIS
jgi:DNA helicase-2/ATP-dependent DNA helicase PcrA